MLHAVAIERVACKVKDGIRGTGANVFRYEHKIQKEEEFWDRGRERSGGERVGKRQGEKEARSESGEKLRRSK